MDEGRDALAEGAWEPSLNKRRKFKSSIEKSLVGKGGCTFRDVCQIHAVADLDGDVGVGRQPIEEEKNDLKHLSVLF